MAGRQLGAGEGLAGPEKPGLVGLAIRPAPTAEK